MVPNPEFPKPYKLLDMGTVLLERLQVSCACVGGIWATLLKICLNVG